MTAKPLLREGGPPPTFRIGPERKPAPCGREEEDEGLLFDAFMALLLMSPRHDLAMCVVSSVTISELIRDPAHKN